MGHPPRLETGRNAPGSGLSGGYSLSSAPVAPRAAPAAAGRDRSGHFQRNVGRSFITILKHQNYHYRLDRKGEANKLIQRWPCRWAQKHKCKAIVTLTVEDPNNLENYISLEPKNAHNHTPTAEEEEDPGDVTADPVDPPRDTSNIRDLSRPTSNLPVMLDDSNVAGISGDFRHGVIANTAHSSPVNRIPSVSFLRSSWRDPGTRALEGARRKLD